MQNKQEKDLSVENSETVENAMSKSQIYGDERRVAWDIAQELNDIEDPDHTM